MWHISRRLVGMVVTIICQFWVQCDIFWSWLVTMVGWCMVVTIMCQFWVQCDIFWQRLVSMVWWCMVSTIMCQFWVQCDIFLQRLVSMIWWCMVSTIMCQFWVQCDIFCMTLDCIARFGMVLHCIEWRGIVWRGIALPDNFWLNRIIILSTKQGSQGCLVWDLDFPDELSWKSNYVMKQVSGILWTKYFIFYTVRAVFGLNSGQSPVQYTAGKRSA